MRRLLLSLIAAAGLLAFAGIANAECTGSHMTTASTDSSTVATSTGTSTPIVLPGQSGG